jgi:asparagine synthase (glutamine-hydrolysing)
MLAGQGADELFGGYKRYVDEYLSHGAECARKRMFQDINALHETVVKRDHRICNYHNVELQLPFAAYEIAQFASSLPLNLKIQREENSPRKLVLREVAKLLGLPESTAQKPKKAMQYATGVDKALKKLAKREGTTMKAYVHRTFSELRRRSDNL